MMLAIPSEEEVKNDLFCINLEGAPGPDGCTIFLYQHCREIIKEDVYKETTGIFKGAKIPQSFIHIYIYLLPKNDEL